MALILEPDTYAFAATVILSAATASALIVRRRSNWNPCAPPRLIHALRPRHRRVKAAEAALRAAEQETKAATAQAARAQREYQRIRQLAQRNFAAKAQEDEARTGLQTALAARRSAGFAVDMARFDLQAAHTALKYSAAQRRQGPAERVYLRAPVAGSVFKVRHQSEGVVAAGQPLIEIGDPRSLEVAVDVLSVDAVRIKPGSRVVLDRWRGEHVLDGWVRLIEPVGFTKISALGVEEQRVNVVVNITSEPQPWERLGPGYRVDTHFVLWDTDRVLQVPASALFRVGDAWAVFVVVDERARRRVVTVGQRNDRAVRILTGLGAGEAVITHPDDTIEDGVAVKAD